MIPRLVLVVDRSRIADPARAVADVEKACAAGLGWIQFRDKLGSDAEVATWMQAFDRKLPPHVRRSVNGRPLLAGKFGWDLHLSADTEGKRPRGARAVGRSVHSADEAREAVDSGADYLIAGTLFATDSKPGVTGIGIPGLRAILAAAGDRPVLGIGGIDARRAVEVTAAGAWGVAVFGAVLRSADPAAAVRELLGSLRTGR